MSDHAIFRCDHATPACGDCEHAVAHEPIRVNSWPEYCHQKEGMCQTAKAVARCQLIHAVD